MEIKSTAVDYSKMRRYWVVYYDALGGTADFEDKEWRDIHLNEEGYDSIAEVAKEVQTLVENAWIVVGVYEAVAFDISDKFSEYINQ